MIKEQREIVYKMAVKKWGNQAQMEMAQEEAIEFALAVRKQIRKNDTNTFSDLVEEYADIEIMLEQIELMHRNLGFREMVDAQKAFKINRLFDRLNKNSFESPTQ